MSMPTESLSPEATDAEWNASLAGDYLWTNTNFGEAVSEVMTPLSWSVLRLVLRDWSFLPGYETPGNIGGRPYLNVSIFATVFRLLGRSQAQMLDAIGNLLYMRLPEGMEIPTIPTSRWAIFSILPNVLRIEARQRLGVRRLPALLAGNPAWFRAMRRQIREAASGPDLVSLWSGELEPHVSRNVWPVLGSASHAADYALRLHHELAQQVGPDDAGLLTASLSRGDGDSERLASLGPVTGLARLVRGEMERADYLERYGHRGPHEFELSVPRPAENPSWLDRQLAHFEAPAGVEAMLAGQRAAFDAAWARYETRFPHQARDMKRHLDEAALRARQREAARSEYVRDRWAVRLFALRAAELTGIGDDVFFLTVDDLLSLLSGDRQPLARVPGRREWYRRYKALPPYPALIRGPFDPFRWAQDPDRRADLFDATSPAPRPATDRDTAGTIAGAPGSAGQVEGTVRRLDRPEDGHQLLPGEILVTAQTDIAWTLLFPRAAAIVTDVGAALSHAAIVARELGIPAVVGCGDATMRLKTGDRVQVDGTHGTVQVLSPAGPTI
jgi:pyruvate,water dikinase